MSYDVIDRKYLNVGIKGDSLSKISVFAICSEIAIKIF